MVSTFSLQYKSSLFCQSLSVHKRTTLIKWIWIDFSASLLLLWLNMNAVGQDFYVSNVTRVYSQYVCVLLRVDAIHPRGRTRWDPTASSGSPGRTRTITPCARWPWWSARAPSGHTCPPEDPCCDPSTEWWCHFLHSRLYWFIYL